MGTFLETIVEEALESPEGVHIDARWVFANKGTRENPVIKARLVCREFATQDGRDA